MNRGNATVKVLETLGQHRASQKGVFQYKRTADAVMIDTSIGTANLNPAQVSITAVEWAQILRAIERAPQGSFRLTGTPPFAAPPNQTLRVVIQQAVPTPAGGWTWNDSWLAYVCAILEHEGSIELYGGSLGPGAGAYIPLRRDLP
jgi:hypothetical protein